MSTVVAQASLTENGASNAEDFQPPTANPQTVPGQIFPETPGLQNLTTQEILQSRNITISVPTSSSGVSPEVAEAKSTNWLMISAIVLVCVAGYLLYRAVVNKQRA